jgi:UDP-glucose 4-epimerase
MTLLITGGAGYIGGQTALAAMDAGRAVLVVDDLSAGHPAPPGAIFIRADAGDAKAMARVMLRHGVTEVLHFAASVVAPRSVDEPLPYYRNNVGTLIGVLEACAAAAVSHVVFSSTAAVYGKGASPAREYAPVAPVSPYGHSKLMAETILRDLAAAKGPRVTVLRYFNVAGADPDGRAGQGGAAATHLVKIACEVATGQRQSMTIHGDDWPTADGTGVRDFVHVHDIARAHLLALDRRGSAANTEPFALFNLGSGRGYSVREVVEAMGAAAGRALPVTVGPRRPGDVAEMVADSERARTILGWTPRFGLGDIAGHALAWERKVAASAAANGDQGPSSIPGETIPRRA